MKEFSGVAYAKINLTLDIIGKRPDGYHDMEMVMQQISLGDKMIVRLETGKPSCVRTDTAELSNAADNLAMKATLKFYEAAAMDDPGTEIDIRKLTPICAGLGGGSADAAFVLKVLYKAYPGVVSEEQLFRAAEATGSDVPFLLFGGTAFAEGKGERLMGLEPMTEYHILLCKPSFPVSTPMLFRAIDSCSIMKHPDNPEVMKAIGNYQLPYAFDAMHNVFEPIISAEHPEICKIEETMLCYGALHAQMTGSGPTVFGLFENYSDAMKAQMELKEKYKDVFIVRPINETLRKV